MYKIAHWLQRRLPFLWRMIEAMNSFLFRIRYRNRLSSVESVLSSYQDLYELRLAEISDVDRIVLFFEEQPQGAFDYFNPHPFDKKTITRLINNKAYLFFIVLNDDIIVGYFFLRCFFTGKCFRGKIVDYRWRNRGIAKLMGLASTDVATHLGLRIFGTISKDNVASLASSSAVNEIRIIENLPNDFVYIEYLPKK